MSSMPLTKDNFLHGLRAARLSCTAVNCLRTFLQKKKVFIGISSKSGPVTTVHKFFTNSERIRETVKTYLGSPENRDKIDNSD